MTMWVVDLVVPAGAVDPVDRAASVPRARVSVDAGARADADGTVAARADAVVAAGIARAPAPRTGC
jgi:hypothetical protein